MSFSLGIYQYNHNFYTGTDTQPDALDIFIKPGKDAESLLKHHAMPLTTWLGLIPVVSLFSGPARISNAAQVIFEKLSHLPSLSEDAERAELWNAIKNLFRGIIETIPLSGIALIIFDSVRGVTYYKKIAEELKEKENTAGVAIDGKIIFTIDLSCIDQIINRLSDNSPNTFNAKPLNDQRLALFTYVCLNHIKREEGKGSKIGMSEFFPKLAEALRIGFTHTESSHLANNEGNTTI